MESRPSLSLADQFSAACEWWREAGVEHDFHDEPEKLLQELDGTGDKPAKAQAAKPAPEPERPKLGGDRSHWPDTLATFRNWWLNEPTLDENGISGRVGPRGAGNAELMVILPMPELDDREALFSGAHGALLSNMLRAMEVDESDAYFATALPRHTPMADWAGLEANGLGDVLQRHIALAAPERLLILGRDVLPLLGHGPQQGVKEIAIGGRAIQALASFSPEALLENARLRADLWRRWLDWTGKA